MWDTIFKFFIGLGFTAAAAATLADTAMASSGAPGGIAASGVPEISGSGLRLAACLLLGGATLILARRRKPEPRA